MRLSTDRILTTHVGSLPRPHPFAGFGAVHPPIAYAKLGSLVEGARLASERLRLSRARAAAVA